MKKERRTIELLFVVTLFLACLLAQLLFIQIIGFTIRAIFK